MPSSPPVPPIAWRFLQASLVDFSAFSGGWTAVFLPRFEGSYTPKRCVLPSSPGPPSLAHFSTDWGSVFQRWTALLWCCFLHCFNLFPLLGGFPLVPASSRPHLRPFWLDWWPSTLLFFCWTAIFLVAFSTPWASPLRAGLLLVHRRLAVAFNNTCVVSGFLDYLEDTFFRSFFVHLQHSGLPFLP